MKILYTNDYKNNLYYLLYNIKSLFNLIRKTENLKYETIFE